MKALVRAVPVVCACQGCCEFGDTAHEVATQLDGQGIAQMVWLGRKDVRPTTRFPLLALDGCARRCALAWLERHGITPERSTVVEGRGAAAAERMTRRIAAELR